MAVVAVSGQQNRPRQGRQQGAPAAYGAPEQPQYGLQADASSLSEAQEDHQGTDWLLKSVPGTPGTDYPILAEVPETKFDCNGQVEGGNSLLLNILLNSQKFHCKKLQSFKSKNYSSQSKPNYKYIFF